MPKHFLILTQARTGSELLAALLGSHPALVCHRELFSHVTGHPERFNTFLEQAEKRHGPIPEDRAQALVEPYLRAVLDVPGAAAAGFKLLIDQYDRHRGVRAWMERARPHVVVLVRENLLRVLLSRVRAQATNLWHAKGAVRQAAVEMPAGEDLLRRLDDIAGQYRRIESIAAGFGHSRVAYESLLAGYRDLLDPVVRALGAEPAPLTSPNRKINRLPLNAAIANWTDVARTLADTPYEPLLDTEAEGDAAPGDRAEAAAN